MPRLGLEELIVRVAKQFGIDKKRIRRRGKGRLLVEARGVVCYLAVRGLGLKASDVGKALDLGQPGVSRAVARGEGCLTGEADLRALVEAPLGQ